MTSRSWLRWAVGMVSCLLLPPAQAQSQITTLKGAGATFPAPLYYKWTDAFAKENASVAISYDSVGSGDGIARFMEESVDFGASEQRLRDDYVAKVGRGVVMVPSTAGMIAIAYNLSGVAADLKLSRDVLADIFLGRITRWDDPRMKADNPSLALPPRNIAVVARLDRSGTTGAFTGHLGAINQVWKQERGVGSQIEWPRLAMLARGNEGVASRLKVSEGSIGYVEYGFAKRLGLRLALLQNREGAYVAPSDQSGQASIAQAVGAEPATKSGLNDPTGAGSYPIVTFSWLLLYRSYADAGKAEAIKSFVDWSLTAGQAHATALGYVPLPVAIATEGRNAIKAIKSP